MLDVRELGQLYNSSYFGVQQEVYVWREHQTNNTALAQVEFRFAGGRIGYIKSNMLNETKNTYSQHATATLNLRKICDGILFLERDGQHFIAILEMKSGFKDVKNKAIEQIPASYVKLKSILNDFASYRKGDFVEFGLIVSYPDMPAPVTSSVNNGAVLSQKRAMVGDKLELVKRKYNKLIKNTGKADFEGTDFELGMLSSVKSCLMFNHLPVRHQTVTNHCVNAVVDLETIIATL